MVVYLAGDSLLGKELYIRNFIKKCSDCNYIKLFSDDKEKLQELKNASQSFGLFSKIKVYDLLDFDEWNKSEKEEFYKLDFPGENIIVFVRTEKVSKDIKATPGKVVIENFEKPKEWEEEKWVQFITENAKFLDLELSEKVSSFIFQLVGTDEYAIITELEKLKIYSLSKPTIKDVEEVTYKRTISKLDEFCYAVSEKRKEEAKNMISEICTEYESVIVSYSLSKHFIELFNIFAIAPKKTSYIWPEITEISKKTGIPTPRVAKFLGFKFKGTSYPAINHLITYSVQELKNIIEQLYYIDRQIKLGAEPKIVFSNFIESISGFRKESEDLRANE
ncbi:MAG: DNA polymerase III subunit delta [Fervidobacterium sp.]